MTDGTVAQAPAAAPKVERIKTHVIGLDDKMEGGVPANYIVLVCGHAGTMKSSFTFSLLYNGHKERNMKGIYLTLEQSKQSIVEHMGKLGMDPRGMDNLIVVDLGRVRKEIAYDKTKPQNVDWLKSILGVLKNYKDKFGCEVLVLDSLAALYSLSQFKNPRSDIFFLFEKLRELGMTVFVISEMLEPDKQLFGMFGVEDFLADGIIHLDMERENRRVNLFLSVVKMRKSSHDRSYYPLLATKDGFEIITD